MKYSICIEPVFSEIPLHERIALVKECGADGIEFWDLSKHDLKQIGDAAQKAGLPVVGCGLSKMRKVRLNAPYAMVKDQVEASIAAGRALPCSTYIGLAGELECKVDSQKSLLIETLKRLSGVLEKENVVLLIEALNSLYDHKGYYLDSSYVGFEIIKAVNSPFVKLLYDCYHMQLMEGNLVNSIQNNIDCIGHFHGAGVPGRHELQQGEIHYPFIVQAAEKAGYEGYFGLEYWPTYDHAQSLKDVLQYMKGN